MENLTTDESNKTSQDIKSKIIRSEQQFERMAHNAGEKAGAIVSDIAHSTADTVKASREYVKEHPAKGVAYAAAAGLVVGSLLTMIMRGRKN